LVEKGGRPVIFLTIRKGGQKGKNLKNFSPSSKRCRIVPRVKTVLGIIVGNLAGEGREEGRQRETKRQVDG